MTLMKQDADLARGDEENAIDVLDRPARSDIRYAWVALSIREARLIAARAMAIVARSRQGGWSSKPGRPTPP